MKNTYQNIWIRKSLPKKLIRHYSPYDEDYEYRSTRENVYSQYSTDGVIPVEGYSYIKEFQVSEYSAKENELENISLDDAFNINLKDYVLNVMEAKKNSDKKVQKNTLQIIEFIE